MILLLLQQASGVSERVTRKVAGAVKMTLSIFVDF